MATKFDHLIGTRVMATGQTIPNAGKPGTEVIVSDTLDSIEMRSIRIFIDGKRPRIRLSMCASVGRLPLVEVTEIIPNPSKFERNW